MACANCPKTIQMAASTRKAKSTTLSIVVANADQITQYKRLFPNHAIRQNVLGPGRIQLILTKTKR